MAQAAPITVVGAQLSLLHKYYIVRIFSSYMQKTLSNCFAQSCALR